MNLASIFGVPNLQPATANDPATKQLRDLKKACQQFEAVFAKQLLSEMRKGVQQTSMGDKAGSAIYQDMMDQTIADAVAKKSGLGIGSMLYKQFEAQVEASSTPMKQTALPAATETHEN